MKANHDQVATSHFQLPWVLGVANTAMENLKKFTLAGVASRISCPMLICWSSEDKLISREIAEKPYSEVGSSDKTLKGFSGEDGGFEHCQVDNRQVGMHSESAKWRKVIRSLNLQTN